MTMKVDAIHIKDIEEQYGHLTTVSDLEGQRLGIAMKGFCDLAKPDLCIAGWQLMHTHTIIAETPLHNTSKENRLEANRLSLAIAGALNGTNIACKNCLNTDKCRRQGMKF